MTEATFAWLPAVIAAISAIIVAFIGYFAAKNQKKQTELIQAIDTKNEADRKRAEAKAEARRKESLLSMELMNATCRLCMITAKKITDQRINGDLKEAMDAANIAQHNYDTFIRQEACKIVSNL
jgi:H+/gluconate symporter-like permease